MYMEAIYGVLAIVAGSIYRHFNGTQLLNKAKEELSKFLGSAFRLVIGLSQEIEKVKDKHMKEIDKYLEDAEVHANKEEEKATMKKIINIKHCLEDTVEWYGLLKQQRDQLYHEAAQSNTLLMMIKKYLQVVGLYLRQLKPLYDIASTVVEKKRDLQQAQLGSSNTTSQHVEEDPRRWFNYTNDYFHVGLDGPKQELTDLLDVDKLKHQRRHFVAVAGQAGVGKTTLVRKVYDQVKGEFQLCAWVTVSQSYQSADILKEILKKFEAPDNVLKAVETLAVTDINEKFKDYLEENSEKRYIVVLDDVWDNDLSTVIDSALSSDQKGSRILMTTREEFRIANYWRQKIGGDVSAHQPLSENDALLLLCKRLFGNDDCDESTKVILREILRKCPLLPLIILAIAGLLSTKPELEWSVVGDDLGREFRGGETYETTKRILLYSYHDLPYELRSCFLYFGAFPEDHEIEVGKLVRIWVAEGLIKSERDYILEEVAQKYMNRLMERGLVMITGYKTTSFLPSASKLFERLAKVHDILYEIIKDKLEEQDFGQVLSKRSSNFSINGRLRRLFMNNISGTLSLDPASGILRNSCSLRSIMLNYCKTFPDYLLSLPPKVTRCVRVVHLEESDIADKIPDEVGNLHNLRLLRLRIQNIPLVPEFISQLLNLETLDIDNRSIRFKTRLPGEIKRLSKLRHLIISLYVQVPLGVLGSLTELQTLVSIDVSESGLVEELRTLYHLKTLYVSKLKVADVPAFCTALQNMTELRSLQVWVNNPDDLYTRIYLETNGLIENPPKKLEELVLSSNLGKRLPRWIGDLKSLVCFSFDYHVDMEEDPLQVLQDLPCLEILQMKILAGKVKDLNFGTAKKFRKLRFLVIWVLCYLYSLEGALPCLQRLHLNILDQHSVDIPDHIREKTSFYR